MTQDILKLDPNFAVKDPEAGLVWYDAKNLPIEGKGWSDTAGFYDRLPARAKDMVPPNVYHLAQRSAGLSVRFMTDSPAISARWKLNFEPQGMSHMPATGEAGLDLYVFNKRQWRWAGIGIPKTVNCNAQLIGGLSPALRHFRIYLPLYNGVASLEIGIKPEATLAQAPPLPSSKPVVIYGTSIDQGGCACRPGMSYPAILGRNLNVPMINLGFSGNGQLDMGMAELMAELDAAVYVLNCMANMTIEMIKERTEKFVRFLRSKRPQTPILLVENFIYQSAHLVTGTRKNTGEKNKIVRACFDALNTPPDPNLHYLKGDRLLGRDGEGTVDGCHPTDLGFMSMAKAFEPVLKTILQGTPPSNLKPGDLP
ncbi:MAG: SGNH/GDSL hydrolase family protein [Lentisphaerae bacterium]|nr:SGNH/GDSL hydrolase family protein [Lentisphaerota bacterium]